MPGIIKPLGIVSAPKAPHALVKPNYSSRTPIVNDNSFTDSHPTIGSPSATFNPGASTSPLPNGPPRNINIPGKRPYSKGMTNKRITNNI